MVNAFAGQRVRAPKAALAYGPRFVTQLRAALLIRLDATRSPSMKTHLSLTIYVNSPLTLI